MGWYYIEHAVVILLGFLLGAAVGQCISPGQTFPAAVIGVVFAIFLHASVSRAYGGDWFWPVHRAAHDTADVSRPRH